MIKITKILTPIFVIFLFITSASAQNWKKHGKLTHEVGFMTGSAHFSTDYGERFLFDSNFGKNVGAGFGIIHYLTWADYRYRWNQRTSFWRDHFRLRNEISYFSAKLNHYGQYVDPSQTSIEADKLRAMHGEAKTINFGTQLEFHIVNITDYGSRRNQHLRFSPYVSFGMLGVYYNPSIYSDFGDGDWESNQSLLYEKWAVPGAVNDDGGLAFSLTTSIGTRYKISEYGDIFFETKFQYFFSDWIDGLNATQPTPGTPGGPNNLFNDWSMFIHIGYVYYLN